MTEPSRFQFTDSAVPRAYDDFLVPRLFEPWAKLLLDAARLQSGEAVLDVAGLEFVDSTGLRAILNVKAVCEENRCAFYLTPGRDQIHDQVRRLLEITGLIDRLPFVEPDQTGA